ncbi:MAG: tetratricopeptide repeat protein, partial [Candidatus Binatia bacterium]
MVRVDPVQPGLPQLDEEVTKLSAHVAWKSDRKDAAKRWFLNYLTIASSPSLDDVDRQILDEILASGMATRARLDLFRSKRLLTLVNTSGQKDKAAAELERLWRDPTAPPDVRADAGYELANYKRNQPDRVKVLGILDSVLGLAADSQVAEKALFRRATVHNREKGPGDTGDRNVEGFRNNLRELLQKFPRGRLADDALNQLASDYLFEQDLENADLYYGKLREFEGDNDFKDSAYYRPAMGFIGRGPGQDLQQADKLLADYVERYPTGVFRQPATFWRGRIAEQRNDAEQARDFFRQVIEQAPYTYYGIRARMHLNEGESASRTDLPAPGSKTRTELKDAGRQSSVDTDLTAQSPYADRLREAVGLGLYGQLLGIENTFSRRLDNVP